MKLRGLTIFLLMQVFFIALGFALFFGLSALKASQKRGSVQSVDQEDVVARKQDYCDFSEWRGKALDEQALIATGRPYRVLPPGSMYTMDYNATRINVHTDHEGIVIKVGCG